MNSCKCPGHCVHVRRAEPRLKLAYKTVAEKEAQLRSARSKMKDHNTSLDKFHRIVREMPSNASDADYVRFIEELISLPLDEMRKKELQKFKKTFERNMQLEEWHLLWKRRSSEGLLAQDMGFTNIWAPD